MAELPPISNRHYAILVQLHCPHQSEYDPEEMEGLAKTAGYKIIARVTQNLSNPNPHFFLGKGKVEIIHQALVTCFSDVRSKKRIPGFKTSSIFEPIANHDLSSDFDSNSDPTTSSPVQVQNNIFVGEPKVLDPQLVNSFDPDTEESVDPLSPESTLNWQFPSEVHNSQEITILFNNRLGMMQILNLSREWNTYVVDRDHVILEIFDHNAKTRESKLQIELVRLALEKSLIKKEIGERLAEHQGSGEKGKGMPAYDPIQRAYTAHRKKIQDELENIRQNRALRRKGRSKFFNVGIIGYTNAGKTTFLNSMAKQALETADQEFTTTSTVSRKVIFPRFDGVGNFRSEELILTDSVGFVYDMSHILLDAFLSTLEELQFSDMLLIIVDIADELSRLKNKLETTLQIIARIGAETLPRFYLFNKADKIAPEILPERIKLLQPLIGNSRYYVISAKLKTGYPELVEELIHIKNQLHK